MSGDVQPRKRKDKKRKKDDLGVDEPRGTAAALGEGDVFMHSHHDHGTGGHWCAKVVFFSLLFVLIGLIGLIILENRGLSELEANAVQSQYSGVLEGWLEDAPEDDHHDEHTLELTHHDDEHDEHGDEVEQSEEAEEDEHDNHDDEDEHDNEDDEADEDAQEDDEDTQEDDEDDEADEDTQEDDEAQEDESQEQDLEANDEEEDLPYRRYYHGNNAERDDKDDDDDDDDEDDQDNEMKNGDDEDEDQDDQDNDLRNDEDEDEDQDEQSNEIDQNDDENEDDDEENNQSVEENEDDDDDEAESNERNGEDEEEDHEEEEEEDALLEVEKIEKEAPEDEERISLELPALEEQDNDDDDDDKAQDSAEDDVPDADEADEVDDGDDADDDANEPDDDFLEADDDEPPIERITAPAGKPFVEVEDETSSEKPTDTLADEEEYEKRQQELRRQEAEASHMWMKLSIGGALLVATFGIVRRAAAASDTPKTEEHDSNEETPPLDRRMTLIPEEPSETVPIKKLSQESSRPVQEVQKQIPSITKSAPTFEETEEDEDEEEPVIVSKVLPKLAAKQEEKKELYSDDEEEEEIEEEEEPEPVVVKRVAPAAAKPPKEPTPEPEEDVPDDVEIIDDEIIEEEEEEAEDEEDISDVDDEELLSRLEAKYGRLPEPERPARRSKDGGNSIEEEWPGEPADAYWRQQLDEAEREFNQGALETAATRAGGEGLRGSARARWLQARALDAAAEKRRDNTLLGRAIAAYLELLKMHERLSDKRLLEISERAINRIQFRGTYLSAEPVYRLLIRRFPNEPSHRTNLTVTFLMANRGDLAEVELKETLKRWPGDRLTLAQYGFILKTQHNRLEEALDHLQRALEGDTGPATEPRFYYHLGDTLLLLGRFKEAHEVHKRGAAHGHFLSASQRSLYNVPRLKSQPWWRIEDTPYLKLARALEKNWETILKEGEAAKAMYEKEKEGLKERGEWSQLDLFVRGREIPDRCPRAPVTCAIVKSEVAAASCRRGQIKFSLMSPGTHVRAHVGPTNCRLRMHLGLSNTKDTFIRVDQEIRQWETGKVLMFDDSFEHEVWHNGTAPRLVLIVDVWHPALTAAERRQLPAI